MTTADDLESTARSYRERAAELDKRAAEMRVDPSTETIEWIPVAERLPDVLRNPSPMLSAWWESRPVLVWVGDCYDIARLEIGPAKTYWSACDAEGDEVCGVTHWADPRGPTPDHK